VYLSKSKGHSFNKSKDMMPTVSLFQSSAEFIYACIRRSTQQNLTAFCIFLKTDIIHRIQLFFTVSTICHKYTAAYKLTVM